MTAFATLDRITDPRLPINKLSRKELEHLARHEGRDDIIPGMPADLMKRRFSEIPPARMPVPVRGTLGASTRLVVPPYEDWVRLAFPDLSRPVPVPQPIATHNAIDELERQWQEQTDYTKFSFQKLKQECKARGIKFKRTDNKAALVSKLNG